MTLLVKNTALRDAFRAGDRTALTEVYAAYSRSLFAMLLNGFPVESGGKRFMFRGYKEPWLLENAVQEIFTRAFTQGARTSYDGVRPYKNYLMTIARNYVVDAFRKGMKERMVPLEEVQEHRLSDLSDISESNNPETAAVTRRLKEETAKFIAALSGAERTLFNARFIEGRSVENCSVHLKISEYRVKRDEQRIKKNFFVFMRERGFFEGYQFFSSTTASVWLVFLAGAIERGGN